MRNAFATAVIGEFSRSNCFFLSGDLGFMALEKVRDVFGARFINAGVAEQNMIGVAAGLAREGFKTFAYSIAPFCYARPFEQIRNDLCFGDGLPVCLVGNGGGYAYGYMGPTHHALEDCAAMNALGVHVKVPAFDDDVSIMIESFEGPTYLRLGYDVRPKDVTIPAYAPWREILPGEKGALVALGPLAGLAWQALATQSPCERPAVWAVCEFGPAYVPDLFLGQVADRPLYVFEEHVAQGGLAMQLALLLLSKGVSVSKLIHRYALGYPTGRFGSQAFHRAQCGLDEAGIRSAVMGFI